MNTTQAAVSASPSALTGLHGERVALCDVAVTAVLRDLLCEVSVAQTYRNDEKVNIEAVYTFPLPLDAVLLELQVEIGGRVLKGEVIEKKAAEKQYVDAQDAGDAAVMLEAIEPGLYTLNVGNLLPGEKATITFSYALLYRWTGERLRFFLPTTIAPRYGDSPHQPHQAPESSLTVENKFSLRVEIFGSLREARFVCPSHAVALAKSADKVVITLEEDKAVMDRDFVLNVKSPQAIGGFALCDRDGEGVAAVASFQPVFPGLQQPRALNLAIVIDCSGSMQGDSIAQARQALDGILNALQPRDHVTLIAFGSSTTTLSDRLLACNRTNLVKARHFGGQLKADMGGTEIGQALNSAYAVLGETQAADVFLVTDGEVSSWESVVKDAQRSGHRVFTVGVGSAVSEAFVRGLAAGTGGECALVSPREGMADEVIRHFERMRAPRAKRAALHWPGGALGIAPAKIGAVFEGDTVISSARFATPAISGKVVLEVETDKGEVFRQELALAMVPAAQSTDKISTVARLAAAARIKELEGAAGARTALDYRLVSPWTNWLVIAVRAEGEKALDLPVIRKVPQTLAAGWGGAGQALAQATAGIDYQPMFDAVADTLRRNRTSSVDMLRQRGVDKHDMPVFSRMQDDGDRSLARATASRAAVPELYRRLIELIEGEPSRLDASRALELLHEAGLKSEFNKLFGRAADLGLNVNTIAAIVLAGLLDGPLGGFLSTETKDALASLQKFARRATDALHAMGERAEALLHVTGDSFAREVLDPRRAHAIGDALERLARSREVLEHLTHCVREATEKINDALASPPKSGADGMPSRSRQGRMF